MFNLNKDNNLSIVLALIAITGLALLLRLIGIDKPDGMWYDEITTYNDAVLPSVVDVIKHSSSRPLYYIILHYWISIFGDADITLRMLSVIFGVITIPVMYFAGSELQKSHKKVILIGLYAALFAAVNSFFIFYSQEIRQYALLVLFSALSAWVLLRVINRPGWLNYALFFVINVFFLITHYISTLIIIPEVVFICFYLFKNNKEQFKNFLKLVIGFSIPCLVVFALLLVTFVKITIHSDKLIINCFAEVFNFDPQVVFVLLQNWFSPVLVGIYNNPINYFSASISDITLGRIIFVFIPVIIAVWFTIKGRNILLIFPAIFLTIIITLSLLDLYVIVPRYTLICLPFFVLALTNGVYAYNKKLLPTTLFVILIFLNLLYIFSYPDSAPKLGRIDKHGLLAGLFESLELNNNDLVVFPRLTGSIDKYNKQKFNKYSIKKDFINKHNIHVLLGEEISGDVQTLTAKQKFKNYFKQTEYTHEFENFVTEKYFVPLKDSGRFILVHNSNVAHYTPERIEKILKSEYIYEKSPLLFMLYSKISLDVFEIANKHLQLKQVRKNLPWTIFIFEKK